MEPETGLGDLTSANKRSAVSADKPDNVLAPATGGGSGGWLNS
jgi:hypothetical protein